MFFKYAVIALDTCSSAWDIWAPRQMCRIMRPSSRSHWGAHIQKWRWNQLEVIYNPPRAMQRGTINILQLQVEMYNTDSSIVALMYKDFCPAPLYFKRHQIIELVLPFWRSHCSTWYISFPRKGHQILVGIVPSWWFLLGLETAGPKIPFVF